MSRTMAKQLGYHFITARLIENASDPSQKTVKDRGIWQVTSKGKWMVYDFAQRGHISWSQQSHTSAALKSVPDRKVMILTRLDTPITIDSTKSKNGSDDDDDHTFKRRFLNLKSSSSKKKKQHIMDVLSFDRKNMTDAFKLMMDNIETSSLLADDVGGIGSDKINDYTDTFYGFHVVEYISQYMSVISHQEAESVASEFVLCGWICQIIDKSDRSSLQYKKNNDVKFNSHRNALYALTKRGKEMLDWHKSASSSSTKPKPKTAATLPPTLPALVTTNTNTNSSTSSSSSSNSSTISTSSLSKKHSYSQLHPPAPKKDHDQPSFPNALSPHMQQQFYFSSDTLSTTSSSNSSHHTDEFELQQQLDHNNNNNNNNGGDPRQFHRSMLPSFGLPSQQTSMTSTHYLRLKPILEDPLLRMYFREFLKQNYSEENLHFWVDYKNMLQHYELQQKKENRILSECYAMYVTYLAPDASKELNIDHSLHQDITSFIQLAFNIHRNHGSNSNNNSNSNSNNNNNNNQASSSSTSINENNNNTQTNNTSNIMQPHQQHLPFFYTPTHPSQEQQTIILVNGNRTQCLRTLLQMYDRVHDQICKNMAEDSLPRFLKSPRYLEWQQKQQLKTIPESPNPSKSTSSGHSHSSHGSHNVNKNKINTKTFDANDDEEDLLHDDDDEENEKKKQQTMMGDDNDDDETKSTLEELENLTLTGITTTTTTTTSNPPLTPTPLTTKN
ncbi:unnamed protein product [Cunninghamella echinulata]